MSRHLGPPLGAATARKLHFRLPQFAAEERRMRRQASPTSFPMQLIVNGSTLDLPDSSRIADVIERLGLGARRTAVEINGAIVPRSLHADTVLRDGDRVEIVQAIGGG